MAQPVVPVQHYASCSPMRSWHLFEELSTTVAAQGIANGVKDTSKQVYLRCYPGLRHDSSWISRSPLYLFLC